MQQETWPSSLLAWEQNSQFPVRKGKGQAKLCFSSLFLLCLMVFRSCGVRGGVFCFVWFLPQIQNCEIHAVWICSAQLWTLYFLFLEVPIPWDYWGTILQCCVLGARLPEFSLACQSRGKANLDPYGEHSVGCQLDSCWLYHPAPGHTFEDT